MTAEKDGTLKNLKHRFIKLLDPDWEEPEQHENADAKVDAINSSEFRVNETVGNKVRAIINDFIQAAPLIEAAGFRIRDLEVELSVIPKLIPHFEKLTDTDDATRSQIMQQVDDKRIIKLLLKALFKADNFQKSLNMGSLEFTGIEIEITAIPAIRLLYKNPINKAENCTDLVE